MKRIRRVLLALLLLSTAACSAPKQDALYTAGTYEGSAEGRNGLVTVEVTVSESQIESVMIVQQEETVGIADTALEEIPQAIVTAQGTEVETISGATITSNAIIKASEAALAKAKGEAAEDPAAERKTEADVIVIGAGGAGLSAAAMAQSEGAEVIVLEVNSYAGGAAYSAAGIILKMDPEEFAEKERTADGDLEKYLQYSIDDFEEPWRSDYAALLAQIEEYQQNGLAKGAFGSIEQMLVDHYLAGHGTDLDGTMVTLNYPLIRASIENNLNIFNWLTENGLTTVSNAAYKVIPNDRGPELVQALLKAAEGVDIQYGVRAEELIEENGKAVQVKAVDQDGKEIIYTARSGIVLASGGYASNTAMVAQYQRLGTGLNADTPSNDPQSLQGDGLIMAEKLGAELLDLSFITTRIMGYQNGCTTDEASVVFSAAQLAVNSDGVRFADESNKTYIQNVAGNNQENGVFYMIGGSSMIAAINDKTAGLAEDLIERGIAFKGSSLQEAADWAGLDAAVLSKTVEEFNQAAEASNDEEFGRTKFNGTLDEGEVYLVKLQMAYHLTFGGLVVDEDMHVLDTEGNPIAGLYAGGDILSGFEGITHQGGNCLTIVIYSGQQAGINAANGK